jgi:transposase InsO family protein
MKALCAIVGISKQALWMYNKRQQERMDKKEKVLELIKEVRIDHKRMGCRKIYFKYINLSPVGRDAFEEIGLGNGYRLKRQRNVRKTTWGQRIEIYPNLIEGKVVNGINQVWQSDIFYVKVEGKDYYGITIEDIYSRKILALHFSNTLLARELVMALKKAIKARSGIGIEGCIFHSDRGSQYIDKDVKALIKNYGMKGSMCLLPQENAYVERVQGSLKYEYINEFDLNKRYLTRQAAKILVLYNDFRPHSSLNMMTPTAFERNVNTLDENLRPEMKVYQWNHELLTKQAVFNKKKKEAKKKKVNINNTSLS